MAHRLIGKLAFSASMKPKAIHGGVFRTGGVQPPNPFSEETAVLSWDVALRLLNRILSQRQFQLGTQVNCASLDSLTSHSFPRHSTSVKKPMPFLHQYCPTAVAVQSGEKSLRAC